MIDIEDEVYRRVKASVVAGHDAYITSEYVSVPPRFPCVFVEESDNYAMQETASTSTNENHAVLMYEVSVFSNKRAGKKTECKEIMATVDTAMNGMGFTRISMNTVPNQYDASVCRMVARYRAVVSREHIIYRR